MFIDTHSHTQAYSPDADQSLAALLRDTETQELAGVMVTEHYDKDVRQGQAHPGLSAYDGTPAEGEWSFVIPHYMDTMTDARTALEQNGSSLQLLTGIEVGYLPYQEELLWPYLAQFSFDGIIASVHCIDGWDIYDHALKFGRDRQNSEQRYLELIARMLRQELDFDIVGHYDYVTRYMPGPYQHMKYRDHADLFDTIFRAMVEQGKSLEINTAARARLLNKGQDIGMPDDEIIKRYLELGGELISLAGDAHHAGQVGRCFEDFLLWLRSLGVGAVTHFVARKPVLTAI